VKPGDVLNLVGMKQPSPGCAPADAGPPNFSDVTGYTLGDVMMVTRTGSNGQVPAPLVLTAAEAAEIAQGSGSLELHAWSGARVTVQGVTAEAQGGALTDPYGHMLMTDGLWVGDKLYCVGSIKAGDACHAPPTFATPTPSFSSVSGFVYLDYCTWDLQPADKCHDLVPPSADCASVSDAGGPAAVCSR
jgi:hypothetical protein